MIDGTKKTGAETISAPCGPAARFYAGPHAPAGQGWAVHFCKRRRPSTAEFGSPG
jgi:hypothetical protein